MAWWPIVQARLVTLLPTLPAFAGVTIYDGPAVDDGASKSYATIGHVESGDVGGSYSQPDSTVDTMRQELGEVLCELVAWTGDVDLPTVRAKAFSLADALDATIRADQTLGVLPTSSTTSLSVDVLPRQDHIGSEQRLLLTVHYTALS